MTNIELEQEFLRISRIANVFDRVIELKNFKKQYKKSYFYKKTRLPIDKAYRLFTNITTADFINTLNNLITEDNLSTFINNQLADIHFDDILNRLIYSIDYEQVSRRLQHILPESSIQIEELKDIMKQFSSAVKELPR